MAEFNIRYFISFRGDTELSKKDVLVTGGCGAIGSRLVRTLLDEGASNIVVLDNLSSSTSLAEENSLKVIYLDVSNSEKVISFFRNYQPQVIYHLAAHFANQNSVDYPISDVKTNVIGLINLLEAQKNNSRLEKFIYSSSSCVYGNQLEMRECDDVFPYETPYAINKYVGEMYCAYYHKLFNIPLVMLRIFNSFGPGELPGRYRNVIPNFISNAMAGRDLLITGTGEETRDFCYVDNTVDLLKLAAISEFVSAEVFNGGSGVATKIVDIAKIIIEQTNSTSQVVFGPARDWDHVKDRKSNIELSKIKLGYNPATCLPSQIRATVEWLHAQVKVQ